MGTDMVPQTTVTYTSTITDPARLAHTARPIPPSGSAWHASARCQVRLVSSVCVAVISTCCDQKS